MIDRFSYPLPLGARLVNHTQTHFRIWAPAMKRVALDIMAPDIMASDTLAGDAVTQRISMQPEGDGYFSCVAPVGAGTAYYYELQEGTQLQKGTELQEGTQRQERAQLQDGMQVPDPASRLQQDDVHGPSVVVDPLEYQWRNAQWRGRPWQDMVIYEIHPGCWGGFAGIQQRLGYLAKLGITAIELMPIADFPGQRNWGYDGVLPFAPDRTYGSPTALKALIDSAHGHGLCVYLDVVYNHFGPEGNYLHTYAPHFFNRDKSSPWGAQIDFTRQPVRDFFTHNALYWLNEYRFDGLRLDAVHAITEKDWLDEMAHRVRRNTTPDRHVHLVLENERNRSSHLEKDFDAQWNDDGHNVLHVLLTGEHQGYYRNYADKPRHKLARMLESGFVYQGEPSPIHGNQPRGTPTDQLAPYQFVLFLQNHDQVGNRALGERLTTLCNPQALRAAIAIQLLSPQIPLLFMDEERGSTVPFQYFTDFHGDLAASVRDGRRQEFRAFSTFADPQAQAGIPDPNAEQTYKRSASFEPQDTPDQLACYHFYHHLLALRQHHIAPNLNSCSSLGTQLIGENAVVARWQLGKRKLSMYINLSPQDENTEPAPGTLLFESEKGAGKAAQAGNINHYTTSVFMEQPSTPP